MRREWLWVLFLVLVGCGQHHHRHCEQTNDAVGGGGPSPEGTTYENLWAAPYPEGSGIDPEERPDAPRCIQPQPGECEAGQALCKDDQPDAGIAPKANPSPTPNPNPTPGPMGNPPPVVKPPPPPPPPVMDGGTGSHGDGDGDGDGQGHNHHCPHDRPDDGNCDRDRE